MCYINTDLLLVKKCSVQCYAKHKNYKAAVFVDNHFVFFDGAYVIFFQACLNKKFIKKNK